MYKILMYFQKCKGLENLTSRSRSTEGKFEKPIGFPRIGKKMNILIPGNG